MDHGPTLYGERLTLRPLGDDDVAALNAILAQPEVRRWWGTDPAVDDQDAFTIVVDGEIAGWVGWYEEDEPDYRHGGLDIFLSPALPQTVLPFLNGQSGSQSWARQVSGQN